MSSKMQDMTEQVKRHSFWIMCGLVALFGLLSWYLATASLAAMYSKNKTTIEGYESTINSVVNDVQHPNEGWVRDFEERNSKQKDAAIKAWEKLYADQKQRVYVWPFGDRFKDFKGDAPPPAGTVEVSNLEHYQLYVKNEFERLAKIVDAAYVEPSTAGSGAGASRGGSDDSGRPGALANGPVHRVIWNRQAEMQAPYTWLEKPTELQVWFTQEEIWVMEAICKAIAATNDGSAGAHDAGVKTIDELVVAYLAAEDAPNGTGENRITRLRTTQPTGAVGEGGESAAASLDGAAGGVKLVRPPHPLYGGVGGGAGRGESVGPAPTGESAAAAGPAPFDEQLKEWRYVDRKGKPLTKEELAASTMTEFRLMPWRTRLVIEQRKFDDLLVAFRNTEMPLEVRQVRINPQLSAGGGESRGGDSAYRGDDGSSGSAIPTAATVTVELRGVAYLINPPDRAKIGVGPVDGATANAAVADAAAPAEGSPPAPTPENTNSPVPPAAVVPAGSTESR